MENNTQTNSQDKSIALLLVSKWNAITFNSSGFEIASIETKVGNHIQHDKNSLVFKHQDCKIIYDFKYKKQQSDPLLNRFLKKVDDCHFSLTKTPTFFCSLKEGKLISIDPETIRLFIRMVELNI